MGKSSNPKIPRSEDLAPRDMGALPALEPGETAPPPSQALSKMGMVFRNGAPVKST